MEFMGQRRVKPGRPEKVHRAWEASQESSLNSSQKPNSCFDYTTESFLTLML